MNQHKFKNGMADEIFRRAGVDIVLRQQTTQIFFYSIILVLFTGTFTYATTQPDTVAVFDCPPTQAGGTVPPAIAICSITFTVNGVELVVQGGDTLKVSVGDKVRFKGAKIHVGPFSGNGGEACVDLAPWDHKGREIESSRLGTHNLPVSSGAKTVAGLDQTWTIGENWKEIVVVLNHWTPGRTKDSDCAGGLCERDDRIVFNLR